MDQAEELGQAETINQGKFKVGDAVLWEFRTAVVQRVSEYGRVIKIHDGYCETVNYNGIDCISITALNLAIARHFGAVKGELDLLRKRINHPTVSRYLRKLWIEASGLSAAGVDSDAESKKQIEAVMRRAEQFKNDVIAALQVEVDGVAVLSDN